MIPAPPRQSTQHVTGPLGVLKLTTHPDPGSPESALCVEITRVYASRNGIPSRTEVFLDRTEAMALFNFLKRAVMEGEFL